MIEADPEALQTRAYTAVEPHPDVTEARRRVVVHPTGPTFSRANRSVCVRLPDYFRGWWLELGINTVAANSTHVVWRIRGPRGAARFRAAIRSAVARHDLLASRVAAREGSLFLERVSEWKILECSRADVSNTTVEPASAQLQHAIASLVWTPLAPGALFRPFLLELSSTEAVCGFVLHHRVVDYYGLQTLAAQIRGQLLGHAPSTTERDGMPLQYSDYLRGMAEWESGAEARRRLEYWRESMRGAPQTCLPDAQDVEGTRVGGMDCVDCQLSPTIRAGLAAAARACRSPLSSVIMAANHIALAATLGRSDVVSTVIVSGRDSPGLVDLVGNLSDCLPLRACVSERVLFPAFVQQLHETFVRGYRSRVKWELIREAMKDAGASVIAPTFNFVMSTQLPATGLTAGGDDCDLSLEAIEVDLPPVRGSGSFHMSHHLGLWDDGHQVYGRVAYTPMRYGKTTVRAFVERLLRCLEAVADDPFVPVGRTMEAS